MNTTKSYDIIIFGASGFTGRLVAEYLSTRAEDEGIRWAMAGRNAEKLAAVRDEMGLPSSVDLVVADTGDADAVDALVRRAKVIITTVGPYQLYGEPLVAACARTGTDYVDLCGEPAWMRQMIDAYDAEAKANGARIVFSCGFDSIPFDLGVWKLQHIAIDQFGAPFKQVHGRVAAMQGTFSGGTAASLKATLAAAAQDPNVMATLRSPYGLVPGFDGVPQPRDNKPRADTATDSWLAPFIMAPINTKNVHRSNALMGHQYGADFEYDEMVMTGNGDSGKARAEAMANANPMGEGGGPKPGEGPSKEERENGFYELWFLGMHDGTPVKVVVKGDRDPGYGSTSKMISEAAMCLVKEKADTPGGVLTPAAAFGQAIIDRLEAHAGLSFAAG